MNKGSAKKTDVELSAHHISKYRRHGHTRVDLNNLGDELVVPCSLNIDSLRVAGNEMPAYCWLKPKPGDVLPVVLLASADYSAIPKHAVRIDERASFLEISAEGIINPIYKA